MIQDNSFPQQYTPPQTLFAGVYKSPCVQSKSDPSKQWNQTEGNIIDESCQQQNNVSTNILEQQWHAQMIVVFDWLRVFLGETFITTFWKNGGQGLHTVPWYQTTCKLKKINSVWKRYLRIDRSWNAVQVFLIYNQRTYL